MKQKMTKIIAFLIMFLVWPSFVLAAPNVTGVSSALSDGNTVTITGSSFGSGPTVDGATSKVILFDDFESGTVGQPVKSGAGSAKIGEWLKGSAGTDTTYYTNTAKVSGSKAFQARYDTPVYPNNNHNRNISLPSVNQVFLSWFQYVPAEDNWPGESTTENTNWKSPWILSATGTSDYTPNIMPNGSWSIFGNAHGRIPEPNAYEYLNGGYYKKGLWLRQSMWLKGSSTVSSLDGAFKYWQMNLGNAIVLKKNKSNINMMETGDTWSKINFSYGRSGSTNGKMSRPTYDDIYVATGPNAQARVEVGNASTYEACTNMTILTPESWTANSINAEVNRGSFPNGPAFLYIIDANGAISNAKEVTFGASGPDTTPPTVTSTAPINNQTGITKNAINTIIFNESLNCSTVNTSSVTMSPSNIQSVTCENSVITITPTNQADSTTYTVTASTVITNTTGLHLASPKTFSYTTATPAATCATNASLCQTSATCLASWPSNNFCSGETPACKSTACAATCSTENWYLCTDSASCLAADRYWWENACRTIAEPSLWYGANLITNPKFNTWTNGIPDDWHSYQPDKIFQDSLGIRMVSGGINKPNIIEPLTTYAFAYNLPVVNGSLKIWYYNTDIFDSQAGTITGTFTTPAEPISDHGLYFGAPIGSDIIMNDVVLKRATLTGCSTDPTLCETEAACTTASWNYCDGVCKAEPCNAEIPVAPCGLEVF